MINPQIFIDTLVHNGIDFFSGVPDSLLKNMCAYVTDQMDADHHIIAANEGGAVALAAGYHLATGHIGCVYMQNSGEGNAVNPLLSLADEDVYQIPLLLIIGWRGEPGVHDEPQHIKQGKVTLSMLDAMKIPHAILDKNWQQQLTDAVAYIKQNSTQYALVIRKGIFDDYKLSQSITSQFSLSREEAIQIVTKGLSPDDIVVSTTGMISRELFEFREAQLQGHSNDFLTVGSMGHASQIALSIALHQPNRRVFVFDGDGAMLMHLGGMAIIGNRHPSNLIHIVFNNGAHDSVGGQPTVAQQIDVVSLAHALGYNCCESVDSAQALKDAITRLSNHNQGTSLINVLVRKGNRKDLGRPTTTPVQNKIALMKNLLDK